jgi:hypothetical protein
MISKKRAQKLLEYGELPWLTSDEVASVARLKSATLRQWISRGYLTLRRSPRTGTGRKMLYSFPALVEICAFASLSRLHFPPSEHSLSSIAEVTSGYAIKHLMELAGVWGDEYANNPLETEHYLIVWRDMDQIRWQAAFAPQLQFSPMDCAWIAFDVHQFTESVVEGIERVKAEKKK